LLVKQRNQCFFSTLTWGKDEGFRNLYHGETEMIKPKTRKSYIWNNRKRAKKPNPAVKEFHDQEIANILFESKLINKTWLMKLSIELQKSSTKYRDEFTIYLCQAISGVTPTCRRIDSSSSH
jgi:hypothetical protein